LIRSDGTASIHEIRRLLNEPADGTEDGEIHVLGLYDVGHLPLWTRDGKKQNVELLLRYLKTNIDPPSWKNGMTRASYDAEKLRIYVWTTNRARHAEIARTLENWTPRLANVSPHPPGYTVPHPIGDLPLWRRDGKGQEVDYGYERASPGHGTSTRGNPQRCPQEHEQDSRSQKLIVGLIASSVQPPPGACLEGVVPCSPKPP